MWCCIQRKPRPKTPQRCEASAIDVTFLLALLVLATAAVFALVVIRERDHVPAGGCTPPAIDGSLQDMIDFANCIPVAEGCGLVQSEAAQDVCRIDPKFVGCVP